MHKVVERAFELDHPGSFASSPWAAAVLGHAGPMMQGEHHGYPGGHPGGPATMPMDLHVPQGFPYYRYRDEALCWSERKPSMDNMGHPTSVNARILELRKEKSRDAARSRRGKENFEFYELAKMLPLPAAITSQLDKASIIRLTISYLKLRDFSGHGDPPWSRDGPSPNKTVKGSSVRSRTTANLAMELFEQHQGTHILQSLDGFAFALGSDGRFLYISETVSIYLGLSQVEMTGSSVFDYIHQADHSELAEQLGLGLSQGHGMASPGSANSEEGSGLNTGTANPDVSSLMSLTSSSSFKGCDRAFCIRMKSTLTKRGCHFKSSGYRVVLLLCRLRPQYTFSHSRKASPPLLGMVALAIALPPPSVHEIRLESDMFVTRLNFDFRIAHCEPRVAELLDYTAEEITGMNLYTLCHGEDANSLRKSHLDLINKGQVLTHYYRLMNKNGGYTWVQTCATVVCSSKNAEEQNIICVNYVISGREYENYIMDCCQLEDYIQQKGVKREEPSNNDPENDSPDADREDGRNSGDSRNQDHLSPPDIEDGNSEGDNSGNQRGRNHLDHVTQLHNINPPEQSGMNAVQPRVMEEKLNGVNVKRPHKRKLSTPQQRGEEDSCCSSDEEEKLAASRSKRCAVLSPSSSCHSAHPVVSPKTQPPDDSDSGGALVGGSTVKDLEHAMSKHLPQGIDKTPPSIHQPTDFSTDALLKQQQQRSTIQWIGAHHHLNHLTHQQGGLPASALLRQLYVNRESVIRANVHAVPGRPGSSGGTYYTGDMNHSHGPLPTPPSSDGSYNGGDTFSGLYPASAYSVAMTPPSSVSPRDKHQQQIHGYDIPYTDVLRHQYLNNDPQAYSALDAYASATQSLDQYHSAGFHLYHHHGNKTNATYPDPLKAPTNWYTAPS